MNKKKTKTTLLSNSLLLLLQPRLELHTYGAQEQSDARAEPRAEGLIARKQHKGADDGETLSRRGYPRPRSVVSIQSHSFIRVSREALDLWCGVYTT